MGSFVPSQTGDYRGQSLRVVPLGPTGDNALELENAAHRYAITGVLPQPVRVAEGSTLVFQFETRHSDGHTCGGAYFKLLTATAATSAGDETGELDARAVTPDSPYLIMFGPDRCGVTDKVSAKTAAPPPLPPLLIQSCGCAVLCRCT